MTDGKKGWKKNAEEKNVRWQKWPIKKAERKDRKYNNMNSNFSTTAITFLWEIFFTLIEFNLCTNLSKSFD